MGKFKMKGFKAFDMKKNSNNRPDGRAGSSVFQIAGKVYNEFSTSPNKIDKKAAKAPIDSKVLKTRPVRKKENSSDPFKVANQYRRHEVSASDQANAKARMAKAKRDNPGASGRELALAAHSLERQGYGVKDEYKRFKEKGGTSTAGGFFGGKQTAKADSPNKLLSKAEKITKAIGKTISGTVGKMTGSNKGTNYKDVMKNDNPNIYNIREHSQKQPDGSMGTVVTYQIKGQKGEYAIAKSRLLQKMAKSRKK